MPARERAMVALAALLPAMWGCQRDEPPRAAQSSPAEVRTLPALAGNVDRIARAVGQIRAVESVTLASEVAGLVSRIAFEEGGIVETGQLLVELDDARARAELAAAKAARDRAARQLERYQQAATTSVASITELDTVRTEFEQAEAEFQLAGIRVDDHRIVAPFPGRVGLRMVSPGAYVRAGDVLTTLATIDPVEIEFAVPEVFLADLRPGLTVSCASPAFPGREFVATVTVVSPEVDPSTRSVLMLASAANQDDVLRPGMFVNVRLVLGVRENAVLVPEESLQYQGSQAFLFVVDGQTARRRRVQTGERQEGSVEITQGLAPGEPVIVEGLQKVRDGAAVRPAAASPPAPTGTP